MTKSSNISSSQLLSIVLEAIDELKATNVSTIDVAGITSVMDHIVIASGTSNRHVKSIAENVIEKSKQAGIRPIGVEGMMQAEWVLVDLADIVVHVMLPETRSFYNLESLWQTGVDQINEND